MSFLTVHLVNLLRERYQIASTPWEDFFNHNLVCEIIYSTVKMYNDGQ